jgi:hypothetical protein
VAGTLIATVLEVGQQGFFARDGDRLLPRSEARGPWSDRMLHGRLLGGIAARAVEAVLGDPAFQPVRLTVDLFKAVGLDPLTTSVTITRDGNRVRAAEVSIEVGGVEAARGSALLLRTGAPPDNPVPGSPPWTDIGPEALEPSTEHPHLVFDLRFVPGHEFGSPGVRKAWYRETRPLVDGEQLTAFQRVALVADYVNPFANMGENGLDYINADLTLYVGRLPVGEWIAVETTEHVASDGVAVSSCRLHDEQGPLGTTHVAAVLNPRMTPAASAAELRQS